MSNDARSRLWITWERQRRSQELSAHFSCVFHEVLAHGPFRHLLCAFRTVGILLKARPRTLMVQNPSMLLATMAVVWGKLARCQVVVDRHTTFLLGRESDRSPSLQIYRLLSRFTLRFAALTVVTNEFLAGLVRAAGGRAFVLPDKLPSLSVATPSPDIPQRPRRVMVVSSFAEDEPLEAVVRAAEMIQDGSVELLVTGRLSRAPRNLVETAPPHVRFTDYLSDREYVELLAAVDLVVVLTTAEYTMLCGCYEAVAAGKALVTSDKGVLREYFDGAMFVDNTPRGIYAAITGPAGELVACQQRISDLRPLLVADWDKRARLLELELMG